MAIGTKISELSEVSNLTGEEYIPLQVGNENKRIKTINVSGNEVVVNNDGSEPTNHKTEIWVDLKDETEVESIGDWELKNKGQANGVASLNADGKIPNEQLSKATLDNDGIMSYIQAGQLAALSALMPNLEDMLSYGVEFDTTISTPTCKRIGSTDLHKSLPIQSKMRGCILDDNGNVVEYLPDNSWENSVRDGSKGQVMVELPAHYRKCIEQGTKKVVRVSEYPLDENYIKIPKRYVSAYQATVQRSTYKLSSVVNTTADYRGGYNQADYDNLSKTMLGKPATAIGRTDFRKYARNRNSHATSEWNCMVYSIQKELYWLFAVEYATLNCQSKYMAELTPEGMRQGGLGEGVTNWNSGDWNNFNGYYPFINCGATDSLGNNTGVVSVLVENEDKTISVKSDVPRYRGVENPFGHIWQWTDGINIKIGAEVGNGGSGTSEVFVCENPSLFTDKDYTGYVKVGNESRQDGYVKEAIFGEFGDIIPKEVGGGSTTYHCDYHYTAIPDNGEALRGVYFGGGVCYGSNAGFVCASSDALPASALAHLGSRLCFIPRINENTKEI